MDIHVELHVPVHVVFHVEGFTRNVEFYVVVNVEIVIWESPMINQVRKKVTSGTNVILTR